MIPLSQPVLHPPPLYTVGNVVRSFGILALPHRHLTPPGGILRALEIVSFHLPRS